MNFWMPSSSSCEVTAWKSMPRAARSRKISRAASTSFSSVSATVPWLRNASIVLIGRVVTVCGPISGSTYMVSG